MTESYLVTNAMYDGVIKSLERQMEACAEKKTYYADRAAQLDELLPDMEKLEEYWEHAKTAFNTLERNPESAQGKLKDFYYDKEQIKREQVLGLIHHMTDIREGIREHRNWLESQSDYWAQEEYKLAVQLQEHAAVTQMGEGYGKWSH